MVDDGKRSEIAGLSNLTAPEDRYFMVYLACFFLGMGMLFPWNMFITATAYFDERLCGTTFQDDYLNYFGIFYNMMNMAGFGVTYFIADRVSQRLLINGSLLVIAIVFALCTGLVMLPDVGGNAVFGITTLLVVISGVAVAVLQAGVFGVCGQLPPLYTQAVMGGQGLGGMIVALVSFLTTVASSPPDTCGSDNDVASCKDYSVDYSAFTYFLVATVVVLLCLLAFGAMERTEFVKHYTCLAAVEQERVSRLTNADVELDSALVPLLKEGLSEEEAREVEASRMSPRGILRLIRGPAFCVFYVFVITLALFPSLTAKIASAGKCHSKSRFYNDLFVPISFVNFNLFDTIGRMAAGWKQLFTPDNIWIPVAIRTAFLPLFLICNVEGGNVPTLLHSDAWPILLMMVFALTNGYLASLCMMFGPEKVGVNDMEWAGMMMAFFLTVGIAVGCWLSFAVLGANTGTNPFSSG